MTANEDQFRASVLADLAQIVDRCDCILVSPSVTKQQAERLGFRYALTPQETLAMAFQRQGFAAKIAVLQHGGHVLPLIDNEANAA